MGLSARQAAKQLELTHQALVKAAQCGRVTREADGTYDVSKVRQQLAENTNALKRRKSKRPAQLVVTESGNQAEVITGSVAVPITENGAQKGDNRTLAEAQRRREWLKVQKDELELARKRAELAPIGEINAWVAGMIIRAREVLVRIGPELKDRLAQQPNPHECERLVMGEVHRALNELAEFKPVAR
jgi:hypothetical protein